MKEAFVQIGDKTLTYAESMVLRNALETFNSNLKNTDSAPFKKAAGDLQNYFKQAIRHFPI